MTLEYNTQIIVNTHINDQSILWIQSSWHKPIHSTYIIILIVNHHMKNVLTAANGYG